MHDTVDPAKSEPKADLRAYFAVRSPYSRLGLHKLERAGFDGELICFTGPPEGVPFSNPSDNPLKIAYFGQDVFRMTLRMGLPLALPDPFDVDYQPSILAFQAAKREGLGLPFAIAISDARWGLGQNISDADVLASCAKEIGWSGFSLDSVLVDPRLAADLQMDRAKLVEDGVFGVPFLVDGKDKYWGHDRFDLWQEARATT